MLSVSLAVIAVMAVTDLYILFTFFDQLSRIHNLTARVIELNLVDDLISEHEATLRGYFLNRDQRKKDLLRDQVSKMNNLITSLSQDGLSTAGYEYLLQSQWMNYEKALQEMLSGRQEGDTMELLTKVREVLQLLWHDISSELRILQEGVGELKTLLALGLLLSLFILTGLFFVFRRSVMRWMVEPLLQINRVGTLVAGGNLNERLYMEREDEIGEIAETLNQLTRTLKEKVDVLEETVRREQKVVRELTILSEFIGYISAEIEMETLYERFAERTRDLLKAEHCFFVVVHNAVPRVFGTYQGIGLDEICHLIGTEGMETVLSEDFYRVNREVDTTIKGLRVKNILGLTVTSSVGLRGFILLCNKVGGFTQEDEDSLFNFAFQAFHAISLHSELTRLATTDGLTGLYNHRMFQERLDEEIKRAERYRRKLFILMIDIDWFKRFNDTYGHQAGDQVLKTVGRIIKENTRSIDFAARYGGEEFVIILPDTDCKNALTVAERLRKAVEDYVLELSDGTKVKVTISIGISCYPEDSKDRDDLLKKADIALYEAKRRGKNRVVLYREIERSEGLHPEEDKEG